MNSIEWWQQGCIIPACIEKVVVEGNRKSVGVAESVEVPYNL